MCCLCSPAHSPEVSRCCSSECEPLPEGEICLKGDLESGGCQNASYCKYPHIHIVLHNRLHNRNVEITTLYHKSVRLEEIKYYYSIRCSVQSLTWPLVHQPPALLVKHYLTVLPATMAVMCVTMEYAMVSKAILVLYLHICTYIIHMQVPHVFSITLQSVTALRKTRYYIHHCTHIVCVYVHSLYTNSCVKCAACLMAIVSLHLIGMMLRTLLYSLAIHAETSQDIALKICGLYIKLMAKGISDHHLCF